MSEHTPQIQPRQYEGPAELISDNHTAEMLYSSSGMPKSYADHLTDTYGPEGVGWGFETDTSHKAANEQERALHGIEFNLAQEGLRNAVRGHGYKSNEGIDLTGKVESRARTDTGNVVLYPDGKEYYVQKQERP